MLPAFSARFACCLTIASCLLIPTPNVTAQDDEVKPLFGLGTRPLGVVMAASANRLKDKATFMFDTAGMPDAVDGIMTRLEDNVDGLQGIDWDKPAGMMVYLDSVFPPALEFVAFLPISSLEEFQSMMELGTVIMRKDAKIEGRYELISPRRNIQIRIEGDYALIQMPFMDPDPTFDRELPDPGLLVASLANQFDVAVSLDIASVPKATRDLILNVATSTMSTQVQQRDDEPESRYQLRKSWMQADIDAFKLMFDECQKVSLGLNVDSDMREANIDVILDVKDGGQLLEEIFASSTKPSYFTPILSESAPVSLSWSAVMAERDQERYKNALEALKAEVARGIEENELGEVPTEGSPIFAALSALQETVGEGHVDMFGQFYNDSDGKLAITGSLRVREGEAIAGGLENMLNRLTDLDNIGELKIGYNQHEGVTFHRLEFRNPDPGAVEIFGSKPGVTIGCGSRSIWICVGGDESFDILTGVMDDLVAAYENPTERQNPAALRLIVKVHELIALGKSAGAANQKARAEEEQVALSAQEAAAAGQKPAGTESPAGGRGGRGEGNQRVNQWRERRDAQNKLFVEALAEGQDTIQVDVRPTDKGMRVRANFEEGFIRGVGRMIGSRFAAE